MLSLSERFLLGWFQFNGRTKEEKIQLLNEMYTEVGFELQLTLESLKLDEYQMMKHFNLTEEFMDTMQEFWDELNECFPLGKFEKEVEAIEKVIKKWKKRLKPK